MKNNCSTAELHIKPTKCKESFMYVALFCLWLFVKNLVASEQCGVWLPHLTLPQNLLENCLKHKVVGATTKVSHSEYLKP